jgi:fimbrial isopeptide formation D2 family protein/uncharacterized repeat protein (TIGR01451 family)
VRGLTGNKSYRILKRLNFRWISLSLLLPILGVMIFIHDKPAQAETNPLNIQSFTYQTFYAYVQAGETLDISFSKTFNAPDATAKITVTGPGNIVHPPDGVANPDDSCQFNVAGTVCEWTGLSAASAGLWEIKFNTVPEQSMLNSGERYLWDITVRDGIGGALTGRVYSPLLSLRQNVSQTNDITAWYQSRSGYLYNVTQYAYSGVNSTLVGDNVGVRENGTCISGYRNTGSWNAANYSVPDLYECGEPFKIFVDEPDSALPDEAPLPDGTMEWLAPTPPPPATPIISNLTFTGDSVTKRSGQIGYDISQHTGQYVVEVDTNGDGIYNGPLDRSFPQFIDGSGHVTVPFDGNYANGDPIPVGQNMNIRAGITRGGELHFTSWDVEGRTGGIEVQVLNGNSAGDYLNVYWNDSLDPNAATVCANSGGGDFSVNGRNSQGGVHTWGNSNPILDCTGQWGNNKTIDDWTYVPINSVETLAVAGLEERVHYRKTVSPAVATITPGQTFTYTVTAENLGDLPLTGLSFSDDLTDVLDDATYNTDVSATSGSASFSSPDINWSGDLAVGQTATITYSVTMNDPVTGDGQLRNAVVGTGANSNCTGAAPIDPDCFTLTPVPDIDSEKTLVSSPNPQAEDTVSYQVTVTNNGAAVVNDLAIADDLSGVLDDATYNEDASATSGIVAFNSATERIVWNGDLAASGNAGDSVTITLTVTINGADNLGDAILNNALISPDCPNPAIFDPGDSGYVATCVTSTPVSAWMARKTMTPATNISTDSTVNYTVEIENTGATDLTGLSVDDDLTDVLDDASYNDNESATIGTASYSAPTLTWNGDLTAGQTATLTYGVTVNGKDALGNQNLVNTIAGSMNCPSIPITDPNDPGYNADCAVAAGIIVAEDPQGSPEVGLANTGQNITPLVGLGALFIGLSSLMILRRKILRA